MMRNGFLALVLVVLLTVLSNLLSCYLGWKLGSSSSSKLEQKSSQEVGKQASESDNYSTVEIIAMSLESSSQPPCRRVPFEATPQSMLWGHVLSPEILDKGYCAGRCPFPLQSTHFNYTFGRFLLDRFRINHVVEIPADFPRSCCVPISYRPLTVVERINANDSMTVIVRDFTVDACGCR